MSYSVYLTKVVPEEGVNILRQVSDNIEVNEDNHTLTKEEMIKAAETHDALMVHYVDVVDEEVLERAKNVKVIATYAVGTDNIDLETATRLGIPIGNTPGVLSDATSEMAWALLFGSARRIVEADNYVRDGRFKFWYPMLMVGVNLTGKTLGIVGAGKIGTAMALKSRGFNMKILYTDIRSNEVLEHELSARRVSLDELLKSSDFVSLHVPLLPETHNLINEQKLALMKPDSYLINTARGQVVDEQALITALKEKRIAGAALDVHPNEPDVNPGFFELSNVVLSPHVASGTIETKRDMSIMAAEIIVAGLKGEVPPNLVNTKVLKTDNYRKRMERK